MYNGGMAGFGFIFMLIYIFLKGKTNKGLMFKTGIDCTNNRITKSNKK